MTAPRGERAAGERPPAPGALPALPVAARSRGSLIRRRVKVRVLNGEKLPQKGPVILASNHVGVADGPLLAIFAPRPVHALTKQEMFKGFMNGFLLGAGQIPLDRFNADPLAVKRCLRVLRSGQVRRASSPRARAARGSSTGSTPVRRTSRWSPAHRSCRWCSSGPASPVPAATRSRPRAWSSTWSSATPFTHPRDAVAAAQAGRRQGVPRAPRAPDRAPRRRQGAHRPDPARTAAGRGRRPRPRDRGHRPGSNVSEYADRRAHRSGPRPRRGRPAQRRQVHARQPDHRPPRGRGRGRAGRDPRPGVVRRQLGRPRVHRRRHRRLGPRRARDGGLDPRPGRGRGHAGRRGAVRGRRDRRHHRRRRGRRPDPAQVRQAGRAGGQQGRRPAHRGGGLRPLEPRAGRAVPGLRAARPRLGRPARRRTRGAARAAAGAGRARSADRAGSRSSASRTSASPRCSTGWPARSGWWSTTSPAPRSTRSTSWSSSAAGSGGSSTPPASASGSRRRPGTSTTPRCAPPPPSTGPRWPCWCSTRRSRSPSRTSGSCRPSARPAGRW